MGQNVTSNDYRGGALKSVTVTVSGLMQVPLKVQVKTPNQQVATYWLLRLRP
jgi:hypothetical protein